MERSIVGTNGWLARACIKFTPFLTRLWRLDNETLGSISPLKSAGFAITLDQRLLAGDFFFFETVVEKSVK